VADKFIENLFPFLFVFNNPSSEKYFLSSWILLIILYASMSALVFYIRDYSSCFNDLVKTRKILNSLKEQKLSPEESKVSLKEIPIINHYWSEFWETVVISKNRNGEDQLFNTLDAEYFFNDENLINNQIDIRYYNTIPSILTGLGILGTFLGLMMGLSQLDLGSSDPDKLREGITGLLGGATIAFSTSVWGIFSSIIFNILEKKSIKKLSVVVSEIKKSIDELFDRKTPEKWLSEIYKESSEQSTQLKRFNDDLVLAMAEALEMALAQKLSPSLDKLGEAISNLNNAGVQGITESIQKSAGGEFERVAEIMKGVGDSMKTTADYGQKIQADLEDSLNKNINDFSNKIEDVFKDITKSTGDQTELIKAQINDLNTTTFDTTNKVTRLVEELSEKFSNNMEQATLSINEERESVGRLLSQVNNSIESMKELMTEAGLVADTFKDSSQPVKEAISFLTNQVKEMSRLQNNFMESSQSSTENWNSSIEKMETILSHLNTGLNDTKDLWSGYKDNFDNLREDLNSIFKSMDEGLIEYRKVTADGLQEQLALFDSHMSNGMGALQGAIKELSEAVEDFENLKK
jgi:prophage DNA circulation protein